MIPQFYPGPVSAMILYPIIKITVYKINFGYGVEVPSLFHINLYNYPILRQVVSGNLNNIEE